MGHGVGCLRHALTPNPHVYCENVEFREIAKIMKEEREEKLPIRNAPPWQDLVSARGRRPGHEMRSEPAASGGSPPEHPPASGTIPRPTWLA